MDEDKGWKRFLLGAVLLEAGIIGFVGWAIALALQHRTGGSLFGLACTAPDVIVWMLFAFMALAGLVLCLKGMDKE